MHKQHQNTIQSETKSNQVYRLIKAAILNGEMEPGEKLVVSQLAKKYRLSIIPVREALSRLETEELIEIVPHTGIHVKPIDIIRLKELYPIRGVLEGFAVRLAVPLLLKSDFSKLEKLIDKMDRSISKGDSAQMGQLNKDFHMAIYSQSGNKNLFKLIEDLWQKTFMARMVFKLMPGRAEISNREHRQILDALRNRDSETAHNLIIHQNEKTLELLIRNIESETQR